MYASREPNNVFRNWCFQDEKIHFIPAISLALQKQTKNKITLLMFYSYLAHSDLLETAKAVFIIRKTWKKWFSCHTNPHIFYTFHINFIVVIVPLSAYCQPKQCSHLKRKQSVCLPPGLDMSFKGKRLRECSQWFCPRL